MISEQEFLKKILYNPFLREKFQSFEENKKYFSYYDKEEYIQKLMITMTEEIQKMNENTFDIVLITDWFECILKDKYAHDVYLIYHNELNQAVIKKAKELSVDSEFYSTYVSNLLEELQETSQYENCLNTYIKYRNSSYITNEEFERYAFALNEKNDTNEENFGYIFNMILERKYSLSKPVYRNFFCRFSKFAANEFELQPVKITLSAKLENANGEYRTEIDKNGNKIHHIYINIYQVTSADVLLNLQTLFHEIKHGVQKEEKKTLNRFDIIKQVEDTFLTKVQGKNFYDANYDFISTETDAQICSFILLEQFLKIYAPLTYRQSKDKIKEETEKYLELESNNQRTLYYKDSYNIHTLFASVVANHPDLISTVLTPEEQKVIFQVFEPNGKTRTPDYFFEKKEKLLNELQCTNLTDIDKLNEIHQKIDFYDAILRGFEYSFSNLKRNYLALENYYPVNPDIKAEVFQYKSRILEQLMSYEGGSNHVYSNIESKMIK